VTISALSSSSFNTVASSLKPVCSVDFLAQMAAITGLPLFRGQCCPDLLGRRRLHDQLAFLIAGEVENQGPILARVEPGVDDEIKIDGYLSSIPFIDCDNSHSALLV
jgi:hypothetical protein